MSDDGECCYGAERCAGRVWGQTGWGGYCFEHFRLVRGFFARFERLFNVCEDCGFAYVNKPYTVCQGCGLRRQRR